MTREEMIKCNSIIHTASASAGAVGFGLAQIPTSDSLIIMPIQTAMAVALGKVFGLRLTESMATATVATALATMTGRTLSQVLIGWLPGVGNIINASTAATITETIGWLMAEEFANQD